MDILWAPWRSKYIQSFKDEPAEKEEKCFLCVAAQSPDKDKELLVVERRKDCLIMLNKFPYNSGHILIAPYRHVGEMEELTDSEMTDMFQASRDCVTMLKKISNPHGFNLGMNLGRVSGAGVPGHLHIHVIPRWNGDTSFITLIGDTKVVSQDISETRDIFAEAFKSVGK